MSGLLLWVLIRVAIFAVATALVVRLAKWSKSPWKKPFLMAGAASVGLIVAGCVLYAWLLSALNVPRDYGWSILFIAPLFNGLLFVFLFYWFCQKYLPEENKKPGFVVLVLLAPLFVSLLQLAVLFVLLLEGSICILMASPFWTSGTMLGALGGWFIAKIMSKITGRQIMSLMLVGFLPLGLQQVESRYAHEAYVPVVSQIEINAPPETVFDLVVAFPEITDRQPKSWGEGMFLLGLPEPEKATVECRDVDCLRRCHFTQNVYFDERITVYKPGEELSFTVQAVVGPQHPVTGADPHVLPGGVYFETDRGQFLLSEIAPGKTLLKGTSWYRMRSSFNWYAQPWAEWMLHAIHNRVLRHVKTQAEKTLAEKIAYRS